MRILLACEHSGRVRRQMRLRGHDAWSADLLPAWDGSRYHLQGDVLRRLGDGWDMVIGFPPCTYLTNMGNAHIKQPGRMELRQEAYDFFMAIWSAPVAKCALENPAGVVSSWWRKPDQIIQPFMFGDPFIKRTCIWLRGLPLLVPDDYVKPTGYYVSGHPGQKAPANDAFSRSLTFPGIARAMAKQWA